MYDENNNNQEFNNDVNPDEHKAEGPTTNFVIQDIQPGEPVAPEGNIQQQTQQPQPFEQTPQAQSSQQPQPFEQAPQAQAAQPSQQPQPVEQSPQAQAAQPYEQSSQAQAAQSAQQTSKQNYQSDYNQGTYRNSYNYQNNYIPQEPEKKAPRKKGSMAGKVAGITAAALLFGTVAGGTMVGINTLSDYFKAERYPQVSQVTTPEAETTEAPKETEGAQASTALATDIPSIVEKAMPSVVAINNTMLYQGNTWFGQTQTYEVPSSGSGIIVGQNDEELLIVTNNHVVEDSTSLSVSFIDDIAVDAAIKGTDSESDLAVIAVAIKDIPESTLSEISVARLGNSDELKVGQGVIAIGNALGYGQSVTVGYVSALNREVKTERDVTRNLLQTDAAINPGNSGGALLNMRGEVIGINAAKYSSTEVEGMGYAIPISKAQDIINNLMTKRTRIEAKEGKAGSLGIQGQNIDEETAMKLDMPTGIFVYKLIEGGAASKTDLREKDIIIKFDDQTVKTMESLQGLLKYYEEGETVDLTVKSLENGTYVERVVPITLGSRAEIQTKQ